MKGRRSGVLNISSSWPSPAMEVKSWIIIEPQTDHSPQGPYLRRCRRCHHTLSPWQHCIPCRSSSPGTHSATRSVPGCSDRGHCTGLDSRLDGEREEKTDSLCIRTLPETTGHSSWLRRWGQMLLSFNLHKIQMSGHSKTFVTYLFIFHLTLNWIWWMICHWLGIILSPQN